MKAIWKFSLGDDRKTVITMPKAAQILAVQEQFREGVIWAIVDPEEKNFEPRYFESFNTGEQFYLLPTHDYLGTYQVDGGNFVVHVFEVKKQ